MNCYSFTNNHDFGGSVYISGTTCQGIVGAYTLNYGDSICMNIEKPIITCENPVFSTECYEFPSPTPTVTQTKTPTNTPTQTQTTTQTSTPTNTPTITPTATLICLAGSGLTASSVAKVVSSGSTIYAGAFNATQYNGTPISNLFGINVYGSLTYSAVSINSQVSGILPQADGKIMVVGDFTTVSGVSRNRIARMNSDGTLDTSFVIGTGFGTSVGVSTLSIDINSSGDYFVGGQFTTYSGVSRNNIIKLTSTGSVDNTFAVGTGTNNLITSVLVQPDGKVIIAGVFTSYSSTTANRIVRLNTNGTIDNTFVTGTGFSNDVFQAILQTDGKIVCVGNFGSYNGTTIDRVCRLNTDGTIDGTFTSLGFNGSVQDITIDVDGNIIVTGQFTTYNGITQSRIVKLNPNGTVFGTWNSGSGAGASVFSVAALPDKRIIVGAASTTTYNGYYVPLLFLLNENGTLIDCDLVLVTPTRTSTPTQTPEPTQTQTQTPSCGTFTTQYLLSEQQGTDNIKYTLFDNPDFTGNANAVCDYLISGTYDIVNGAINVPYSTTMVSGDHTHTYNTGAGIISGFTVSSVSTACGCVNVIFNQITPTPTTTTTQTSTPTNTNTPTNTPTPSVTQTQTSTPTLTNTSTTTQTNTPTPSITPTSAITTCAFLTVRTDASLDVPITGVEVNSVPVSYLSGTTFTIDPSDAPGYFNTTQTGSSVNVDVTYGSNIAGQRIELVDCNAVVYCCNLNPGGGTCSFTGVDLSCNCNWEIQAYDGTC
jgi:uncharacterized delta-60 repeat protein